MVISKFVKLRTINEWPIIAHCFFDGNGNPLSPSTVQVVAGRSNNYCQDLSKCNYGIAQSIQIHPNYNKQTLMHDIAIIILDRNLQIDGTTTRLAYIESGSVPTTKNLAVTVAGWGYIDSTNTVQTNLRKVNVPVVTDATCGQGATSPNQICAGDGAGHDSCKCLSNCLSELGVEKHMIRVKL